MGESNPVVLLSWERWHIVESSRQSSHALCGRRLSERRAHARLKNVGRANVCPDCLARHDAARAGEPPPAD